jgi:hypothetical protein
VKDAETRVQLYDMEGRADDRHGAAAYVLTDDFNSAMQYAARWQLGAQQICVNLRNLWIILFPCESAK